MTLDDAEAVVAGCHTAGGRVVVGWDDTAIARAVIERIRSAGVPVVEVAGAQPPHTWGEGTDAVMEAAAVGADRLLDDLLARGVDVQHRDDSGSTALHHAAAHGNLHAIEALVSAGADLDLANHDGFTPHMLALATRQQAAAQRLVALGARASAGQEAELRFRRSHHGTLYWWALIPLGLIATAIGVLWPLSVVDVLVVAAVLVGYAVLSPPRAFWSGGVPRRLRGTTLTLRGVMGRTRQIDLSRVALAAIGGSASGSGAFGARWLVLAHPDGHPVGRRALRRLRIPAGELDEVAARMDRAVVVHLDGFDRDEVLVPVGNLLSGRGVDLSATLRRQLARARRPDADRPDRLR